MEHEPVALQWSQGEKSDGAEDAPPPPWAANTLIFFSTFLLLQWGQTAGSSD